MPVQRMPWSGNTRGGRAKPERRAPIPLLHRESRFGSKPRHPEGILAKELPSRVLTTVRGSVLMWAFVCSFSGYIATTCFSNMLYQRLSDRFTILLICEVEIVPQALSGEGNEGEFHVGSKSNYSGLPKTIRPFRSQRQLSEPRPSMSWRLKWVRVPARSDPPAFPTGQELLRVPQ